MKIQIDVCADEAIKRGYEPGRHVVNVCVTNLSQTERDLLSGHVRRLRDDDVYELYSDLGVDVPDEPTWAGIFSVLQKAQEREQKRNNQIEEKAKAAEPEARRLLAQGRFDLRCSDCSAAGHRWSVQYPRDSVKRALCAEPGAYDLLYSAACDEATKINHRERDDNDVEQARAAKEKAEKEAAFEKAKSAWLRSHGQLLLAEKVDGGFPCESQCYDAVAEYYRTRLQTAYPAATFVVDIEMERGRFISMTGTFPTDEAFLLFKVLRDDVNFMTRSERIRLFEAETEDDDNGGDIVDCVELTFECPWNKAADDYLVIYAFPERENDNAV